MNMKNHVLHYFWPALYVYGNTSSRLLAFLSHHPSVAQALAWSQLKARAELSSSRVEPGITHGPKYLQLRLPSRLEPA